MCIRDSPYASLAKPHCLRGFTITQHSACCTTLIPRLDKGIKATPSGHEDPYEPQSACGVAAPCTREAAPEGSLVTILSLARQHHQPAAPRSPLALAFLEQTAPFFFLATFCVPQELPKPGGIALNGREEDVVAAD